MKVFISWSGDLSREIAGEINIWLPRVLQAVKPYFTPDDIEKGVRWLSEIANELEQAKIGIICITPDNIFSPWLLFEAGAISKVVDEGAVCPILFGLDNAALTGPLSQFQTTTFRKGDFLKLVKSVNEVLGDRKIPDGTLNDTFNAWWPGLKESIKKILILNESKYPEKIRSGENNFEEVRSEREILEEILVLARLTAKTKFDNDRVERSDMRDFIANRIYSDPTKFKSLID